MRTVELSDEVFERAAQARGMSVPEYLGRKVVEDAPSALLPSPNRARFPIFESNSPGSLRNTKELLERIEREDDLRRGGVAG